tara:strand:- start:180 stop:1187 length:1008 start_codon:yes stop_codon:yes gene_type:complete
MKIIVTGGCGFIGTNFVLKMASNKSNKLLIIDKLTYAGNQNNLLSIKNESNYNFIKADICDRKHVEDAINNFLPDAIVHFAAESHVDNSIAGPMDFINTNILGTATLLEICQSYIESINNNFFKFLHISTDEVFGSLKSTGFFSEKSPYNPSSPYSASKASSDHLVRAWHKTYDFPALITNCSNNYGPYQYPEKLIPLIINNCIDEKPLPIYGKGTNIRDWLFVEDHCDAIHSVLLDGRIGETYNIGGNNELQNIEIVKHICSIMDEVKPRENGDSYEKLISFVPDRPGHDFRYSINTSKIKKELGWEPKESFKSGIRKTIKWYLDNINWLKTSK